MSDDLRTALDRCLSWLRSGMDVESCLARYPEYADQLSPLLHLASHVDGARPVLPSAEVRTDGERRMLAAYAQQRQLQAQMHPVLRLGSLVTRFLLPLGRPVWQASVLMLAVVLVAAGGIAVTASTDSLPGDALYPVKQARQRAQLAVTLNPTKRGLMQAEFNTQERLAVQAVLGSGREVEVAFQGILQEMDRGLWLVGGLPVTVPEGAEILGQPYLGALVRVRGYLPGDGRLLASQLLIEPTLPPWSTVAPNPTETTRPEETPDPALNSDPAEGPTPSPTPTATSTLEPDGTSRPDSPSPTMEATVTLIPSQEPGVSRTEESDSGETEETPQPPDGTEPGDGPEEQPQQEESDGSETPEPDGDDDKRTPEPAEPAEPEDDEGPEEPGAPDPDDDADVEDPEDLEADDDRGARETEEAEHQDHDDGPEPDEEPDE